MSIIRFSRLETPPPEFADQPARREVELRFTTNRDLPELSQGLELCEFLFEQTMLDRNDFGQNLRWHDIQHLLTRSIAHINSITPGMQQAHTPMPVPITPPARPILPPLDDEPIDEPDEDTPTPPLQRRGTRRLRGL